MSDWLVPIRLEAISGSDTRLFGVVGVPRGARRKRQSYQPRTLPRNARARERRAAVPIRTGVSLGLWRKPILALEGRKNDPPILSAE